MTRLPLQLQRQQSEPRQQPEALAEQQQRAAAAAEEAASPTTLAQRLQAQETAAAAAAVVVAPEPALASAPAAAQAAQSVAQPGAAAGGRVVVRDAAALWAVVADGGGAPVVELDPAGGVFALGTKSLEIRRPVRLVSGAGGRATLAGGERTGDSLVEVGSPGVALEGLALAAGTDTGGDQQLAVRVDEGGEAELRGCDVTGAVYVHGTAALRDCAVHDVTDGWIPGVYVIGVSGAARVTLERCAIERCAGNGVQAVRGGVARLVETTVRECQGDDYRTRSGGVIEGVAPGLITKR
jgi:hypothetical protein